MKGYRDSNLKLMEKSKVHRKEKKTVHITQAKFIIPIFEADIYNSEHKVISVYTKIS